MYWVNCLTGELCQIPPVTLEGSGDLSSEILLHVLHPGHWVVLRQVLTPREGFVSGDFPLTQFFRDQKYLGESTGSNWSIYSVVSHSKSRSGQWIE